VRWPWAPRAPAPPPVGVRLVYDDGTEDVVSVLLYEGQQEGIHVWVGLNPRPGRAVSGVRCAVMPPRTTVVIQ